MGLAVRSTGEIHWLHTQDHAASCTDTNTCATLTYTRIVRSIAEIHLFYTPDHAASYTDTCVYRHMRYTDTHAYVPHHARYICAHKHVYSPTHAYNDIHGRCIGFKVVHTRSCCTMYRYKNMCYTHLYMHTMIYRGNILVLYTRSCCITYIYIRAYRSM
jgi:hypothetical protein